MVARCAADDVDVSGSLAGSESHEALAGVRAPVTGADRLCTGRLGDSGTVLGTDTTTVLTAGTVTTRHRRTRVYRPPTTYIQ